MDDEKYDCDANAGIRHVESRPRMSERHVKVEQKKIDYVPVKQAVSQIPEDAGQQQGE